MENSEMQKHIINLGKALVEELSLDPGVDTLARWMAHYIAEQITIVESTTGDDKIKAEQQCFETILKLWQHRSSLPIERRPFESFDPIFRALERLDPENPNPYFYSNPKSRSSESDDSGKDSNEVQQWLDVARGIDQAVRVWLEYVFQQAALNATDEKTIAWLENAIGLSSSNDISIIVRLIDDDLENGSKETTELEQQDKQEKLKSRIKQLDVFIEFSQVLHKSFLAELENVTQGGSSADAVDTDSLK
jgi:hypothetical protein